MTTTTLDQVLGRIRERHAQLAPVDIVDRLDKYQLVFPDGDSSRMESLTGNGRSFGLAERAETQLLQRLQVPAVFFKRLPGNLKWAAANWLVQNGGYDKDLLIRSINGGTARGILSSAYTSLDDVDVVPLLADVLDEDAADAMVEIMDFHPDFTHIRLRFPGSGVEVRPNTGDIIYTGLHFSNSEIGMRAVHIDPMVWRLVCKNGAVRAENSSRTSIRHIGDRGRLKDQLRLAVVDAKTNAIDLVHRFKAAVNVAINEPLKVIEQHSQQHDLTQEQLKMALASFNPADSTLFGVVQAFTSAAQAELTMERRYQVERVGTALLQSI